MLYLTVSEIFFNNLISMQIYRHKKSILMFFFHNFQLSIILNIRIFLLNQMTDFNTHTKNNTKDIGLITSINKDHSE